MKRFARLLVDEDYLVYAELGGGRATVLTGAPWEGGTATTKTIEGVADDGSGASVRALAPVIPSKIVCVGRNYKAHAKELGNEVPAEPLLFTKPPSSVLDPGGSIELPPERISKRVDHEAEIALVIGKRARRVSEATAMDHVFGVTLAFDITARDLQKKDGQWTRAKGMDTFCPLGPVVVAGVDPQSLSLECKVNGEIRQQGHARDMIFSCAKLIAYVTDVMTLEPGDVILTGTPEGVGPLAAGDVLEHHVDGIGTLRANVVHSAE